MCVNEECRSTAKIQATSEIGKARKDIARIKTVMRERERQAAPAGDAEERTE